MLSHSPGIQTITRVICAFCLALLSTACALPPAKAEKNPFVTPIFQPLVNGSQVILRIVQVNDAEIPAQALQAVVAHFSRQISGRLIVQGPLHRTRDLGPDDALSNQQVNELLDECPATPSRLVVIVAPDFEERDKWAGRFDYGVNQRGPYRHILARSRRINAGAAKWPPVSRDEAWKLVLLHELGHALGLPKDPSHVRALHCTHPECLIYAGPGAARVLTAILRWDLPDDFCAECRADLAQARRDWGDRPLLNEKDFDWHVYYDELARLNPANPFGYMFRGVYLMSCSDWQLAAADFDRAIEIAPNAASLYSLRSGVRQRLGEYAQARADLERALEFEPQRMDARQQLAWLLATCPQDDVRDGRKALELAARLQGSEQPTSGVLATLAAAYAETGAWDQAIATQSEALKIATDQNRDSLQKRLNLYRSHQPCRDPD